MLSPFIVRGQWELEGMGEAGGLVCFFVSLSQSKNGTEQ